VPVSLQLPHPPIGNTWFWRLAPDFSFADAYRLFSPGMPTLFQFVTQLYQYRPKPSTAHHYSRSAVSSRCISPASDHSVSANGFPFLKTGIHVVQALERLL